MTNRCTIPEGPISSAFDVDQQSAVKLGETIHLLLGDTFGADPFWSGRSRRPITVGLHWSVAYGLIFCLFPYMVFKDKGALLLVSVWGVFYLFIAAILAAHTSSAISEVLREKIIPNLSGPGVRAIDSDLTKRFNKTLIAFVSFSVAGCSAAISGGLLYHDALKLSGGALVQGQAAKPPSVVEISWICCGYFFLYLTAARTTFIARFYSSFTSHLEKERSNIYSLDPARSLHVQRTAGIGQRVVVFWFFIACIVATLVPLFYNKLPYFVEVVVPVSGFFSIIFGTILYLQSEAQIRKVVDEVLETTLQEIETESGKLLDHLSAMDDAGLERLKTLSYRHDKLISTGAYRSPLLSTLSFAGSLIGPALTVVWSNRAMIQKFLPAWLRL